MKHIIKRSNTKKKSQDESIFQRALKSRTQAVEIDVTKKRKLSSNNWLRRHLNDPFVQAAQKDGFVSRAAYKLLEIDDKFHIFKKQQVVMDLGCAPGSWLQVIESRIRNNQAILVGVDLLPLVEGLEETLSENGVKVKVYCGDFMENEVLEQINAYLHGRKIDVITSDIAPNTMGMKTVDHLALMEIANYVLDFANTHLIQGGSFVIKLFQGSEQNDFIKKIKELFDNVKYYKPVASRQTNSEIYIVAIGKKAHSTTKVESR